MSKITESSGCIFEDLNVADTPWVIELKRLSSEVEELLSALRQIRDYSGVEFPAVYMRNTARHAIMKAEGRS